MAFFVGKCSFLLLVLLLLAQTIQPTASFSPLFLGAKSCRHALELNARTARAVSSLSESVPRQVLTSWQHNSPARAQQNLIQRTREQRDAAHVKCRLLAFFRVILKILATFVSAVVLTLQAILGVQDIARTDDDERRANLYNPRHSPSLVAETSNMRESRSVENERVPRTHMRVLSFLSTSTLIVHVYVSYHANERKTMRKIRT